MAQNDLSSVWLGGPFTSRTAADVASESSGRLGQKNMTEIVVLFG